MDHIRRLAGLVAQAAGQSSGARVAVGQIRGTSVQVGSEGYSAEYAADVDKYAGRAVYVLVDGGKATVISER